MTKQRHPDFSASHSGSSRVGSEQVHEIDARGGVHGGPAWSPNAPAGSVQRSARIERRQTGSSACANSSGWSVAAGNAVAAISELRDGERAMDGLPARGFASRDPSEGGREDEPERRPLVGRAEDAGSAGQAAPTQDVGRVGTDPRLRDHVPDQALGPAMDRAPMIDRTREGRCGDAARASHSAHARDFPRRARR